MNLQQRSRYHLEGAGYRVSKQYVGERTVYTAWVQSNGWQPLAYVGSAERAKRACQQHQGEGV